jgi:hypothetical protein
MSKLGVELSWWSALILALAAYSGIAGWMTFAWNNIAASAFGLHTMSWWHGLFILIIITCGRFAWEAYRD